MNMDYKRHLDRLKSRVGLVGGPLKLSVLAKAEHSLSAGIDPKDWHIEMTMRKGWNPVPDRESQLYAEKKSISDPVLRVLEDILYHECGHWELPRGSGFGCPGIQMPVNYHDIILDNVTRAVQEAGVDEKMGAGSGQTIGPYIANALEDIIVNANARRHTGHEGLVLFWNDQGLATEERTFTKFYEAFVKLNMFLWGDAQAHTLLSRFYKNDEDVKKAVDTVRSLFKRLTWKDPLVKVHESGGAMRRLYDKEQWGALAYRFAEAMLPLIEKQPPTEQHFGASEGGSTADRKLGQPGEREKTVGGRHERGEGISSYMNPFEYLDTLYRHLAKSIPVHTETPSTSLTFPIATYGRDAFDPFEHSVEQVELNRLEVDEDGLHLSVSPRSIYTNRGVRRTARGFPRFKLMLLDTSSSMQSSPDGYDTGAVVNPFADAGQQWGDKSSYHYALLGLYGIEAYLEQAGLSHEVQSGLVNFSSTTMYKGMLDSARIDEIFKLALTPQFGGTMLTVDEVAQQFEGETFCMSLSDGGIENWHAVSEEFRKAISDKLYVHIQIGPSTDFTEDLEKWGVPVHYVTSGEDLSSLMVDVTAATYNDMVRERAQR